MFLVLLSCCQWIGTHRPGLASRSPSDACCLYATAQRWEVYLESLCTGSEPSEPWSGVRLSVGGFCATDKGPHPLSFRGSSPDLRPHSARASSARGIGTRYLALVHYRFSFPGNRSGRCRDAHKAPHVFPAAAFSILGRRFFVFWRRTAHRDCASAYVPAYHPPPHTSCLILPARRRSVPMPILFADRALTFASRDDIRYPAARVFVY